jgi:hypothetical protein
VVFLLTSLKKWRSSKTVSTAADLGYNVLTLNSLD